MNQFSKINATHCAFKRWGNKTWSAFMSIGKSVSIATLSIAYFTSTGLGFAQQEQQVKTPTSEDIELNELKVTAEFSPQLQSEAARVVSVITKKEIQAAAAQSVNELLEFALGVDIRQRGPQGIQADVSVRGGSFDQVMFLLNGINVTDPQTGHFNLNIPVDITSIERIELLEGPGARYWGPNAFSGAINIVTKQFKQNGGELNVSVGDFGFKSGTLNLGFKSKNANNYISVGSRTSDGYARNADYQLYNVYFNRTQSNTAGIFSMQGGYTDKYFGANTFYSARFPNQGEQNKTAFGSIKFESNGEKLRFFPSAYARRNHDRFELYREQDYFEKQSDGWRVMGTDTVPAASWADHNYHTTTIIGADLNAKYYSKVGVTSFGMSARNEHIYSTDLGETMEAPRPAWGEPDGLFTKSSERLNKSAFIEHYISLGNVNASVGLMANQNTLTGDEISYYPGVDVSYNISTKLKAYASYNESFRLPTFTDLYYNGPENIGNQNLTLETAQNYELGFKYVRKGFNTQLAVFNRNGENLIDWVRINPTDAKLTTVNHHSSVVKGINIATNWNPTANFGSQFFIKNIAVKYSYLNKDIDLKGMESSYVGDYLKHKFTTRLTHSIIKNLQAHWGLRYQDRAGSYEKYMADGSKFLTNFDPFWTTDLKMDYTFKNIHFYVEARNLFDTSYVDYGNILQPGRWFISGVNIKL